MLGPCEHDNDSSGSIRGGKFLDYLIHVNLLNDSWRGPGIFFFSTASRTALAPTQPPIQWVRGALSLGVKRPGREADHSPPSSAEVRNAWNYTFTPQYAFMAWYSVESTGINLLFQPSEEGLCSM
jgi:hypothetical protein